MAPKDRADQTEQRSPLLLPNKISDANPAITSRLSHAIKAEIQQYRPGDRLPRFFLQMATLTSILPPHWESFPSDLKMFLEKEMFDPVIRHVLESEGLLNWCPSVQKLYPLITPGDGNCLLHAVSLAMWAVDDSELVLRNALYQLLREDKNDRNHLRWQRERIRVDSGIPGSGLRYNSTEWQSEWEMVKTLASPERRPPTMQGLAFESLEQYHVFMLANMLRRPIIVFAQDMMRSQWGHSLQSQHLHGVYLPLNWDPSVCCSYPILLGFHQNHFAPLLCTSKLDSDEDTCDYLIPFVQRDLTHMAVHFLEEEEEKQVDSLLRSYLIIEDVFYMGESLNTSHSIQGARLVCSNDFPEFDLMIPYLQLAETHYRAYLEMEYGNGSMSGIAGASSAALGKDMEKPQLLQEQSNSLPSIGGTWLAKPPAKHSWSGSGAPVSQPSDVAAKSRSSSSRNPPLNRALSLINQSCKTEGCIYYRSVSTGEYCHECFQKRSQSRKCQGERCLNPSEQGCQGLCQVCFDQRKLMEVPATKSSAPSVSLKSLDPVDAKVQSYVVNISKPGDNILMTKPLQTLPDQEASSSGSSTSRKEPTLQGPGSDDELNSFVVHQKLPTKKCIIPECPMTGDPNKSDMCSKCYTENLQVVQELEKSKKVHQPAPARAEFAQSASEATAYGNGRVPGALLKAAAGAASSDPQCREQKPASRFTVQKNICAKAGCDGVRLVNPSYQGYCISCFTQNQQNPSPAFASRDFASHERNRSSQYQLPPNLARPTYQPAPVKEFGGNLEAGYGATPQETQKGVSQNLLSSTAVPAAVTGAKPCMHPRCNNLAVPPKFMLCDQCIEVTEIFQGKETLAAVGSAGQQTIGSDKQVAEQTPAQPKEAAKQDAQSPRSTKGHAKADVSAASGFKNVQIIRVKCQVPGGCVDDMYGDPELDHLCSRCFAKMSFRRTRNRSSPSTRPAAQLPVNHYNTAPIKPSPRMVPAKPTSQTEIIYVNREAALQQVGFVPRPKPLPDNFQACASEGCVNQANLQILEGFCNECHQVYRNQQHGITPEVPRRGPNPEAANRGRFAQSSQSTVPEAWNNPPAHREEKILNVEGGAKAPPMAQPNRTDMCCLSNDCTNYGNPRCQGYCNSCFRLLKN